jgi:thiamine-phosphate pyrophosphorylase
VPFARLYAIADKARLGSSIFFFAQEVSAAGVTLIQYRNKGGSPREILSDARELRRLLSHATLIMNDRPDLAIAAGFNGAHVGQDDLPAEAARKICPPPMLVGVSTHNMEQLQAAEMTDCDYIAFGPVFSTWSKANPDPVVGSEGIRMARRLTKKPLVAIGGITRTNCQEVIAAGADSVAVISDLLLEPRHSAAQFLELLV